MIEQDIAALAARDRVDLQRLEEDLWRREGQVTASRRAGRTLASLQGAVVALSIISSATAGIAIATDRAQAQTALLFSPGAELAPSSLLFGKHP